MMHRTMVGRWGWLLVLAVMVGPLAGQPGSAPGTVSFGDPTAHYLDQRRPMEQRRGRPGRRQRPRDFRFQSQHRRERLNTLKMWKMTEYLDLSEQQAERFFPRERSHQKDLEGVDRQRRERHDNFQEKIDAGTVNGEDIDRFVAARAEAEKSRIDLRTRHVQDLGDVLSDNQRARMVVFNEYFMRQIRRGLGGDFPPDDATGPPQRME